jgi:GT2 family glycosyltransferase
MTPPAVVGEEAQPNPRSMHLGVVVVVVTYNSAQVLPGLLNSLPDGLRGIKDYEVIVVDNDSRDSSASIAETHPIRPRVLRTGRNGGFAAGINAAAAVCGPDAHLLILNPDVRLRPGSVQLLLARIHDPHVGIAVPRNLNDKGGTDPSLRREPSVWTAWSQAIFGGRLASRLGWSEVINGPGDYDKSRTVQWATGCALLVSSRALKKVPRWDETYFLYSEEVDYQRKIRFCGLSVAYVPESQIVHIGGESGANPELTALLTLNRIRYFRCHHGALSSFLFALGVTVGEALRAPFGATHRVSLLRIFLSDKLPHSLRTP